MDASFDVQQSDDLEERLYDSVALRIRRLRSDMDLTQDALAKLAGLSRAVVANIESRRQRPPLGDLYKIAMALQRPITDLLPTDVELVARRVQVEIAGQVTSIPPSVSGFLARIANARILSNDI